MSQGCTDCFPKEKERNRNLKGMLERAKMLAREEQKTKAVIEEPQQGIFITDIEVAIREYPLFIKGVFSGLQ